MAGRKKAAKKGKRAKARERRKAPESKRSSEGSEPKSARRARPEYSPVSSEKMPRFAGVSSFLRLPLDPDPGRVPAVDVLLCGVPFDGGTSYRSGSRFGPRAVREASSLARRFSQALGIDIYEELLAADGGDIVTSPHDMDPALAAIGARAEAIARSGVIGGFIGGDQTITLGALRGIHRAKLKRVHLLHIDSHNNTAGAAWQRDAHHGSAIRLAVEEGLIQPRGSLQLGIRGPYSRADDMSFAFSQGFEVVTIDEIKWDFHSVMGQVRKLARHGSLYVSVDLTALDPAFAPGVGIPAPGGMTTWELQQILRALVGADIVGFDVVELSPPHDTGGITALAAVTVVQEIMSAIADTRRSARPAPSTHSETRRGRKVSP